MRGPTHRELQEIPPPALRTSSKITQAYLDIRDKILAGEYRANQIIVPKEIEEKYHINNTSIQILLVRLANEGLIRVFPIKERTWPYNASLNEYRVANLTSAHKSLLSQQRAFSPEKGGDEQVIEKEILVLKIQYADGEIAQLLALEGGEKVVVYRERQRLPDKTVVAVNDIYFPFWFAEILPELEQHESDVYQLLRQVGRIPATCTGTIEVVQARSPERVLFELSPDDPAPLFKLQQQLFDRGAQPLAVQFLTLRGEQYRFHSSFSFAFSAR